MGASGLCNIDSISPIVAAKSAYSVVKTLSARATILQRASVSRRPLAARSRALILNIDSKTRRRGADVSSMMTDIIQRTAVAATAAIRRVSEHIERTELRKSSSFSEDLGAAVYFKLENCQTTGSFKLRGATNRLMTLSAEELARGCVAASSGNHGAAVACAMQKLNATGVIFVPEQTSSAKTDKIKSYGGEVRYFGTASIRNSTRATMQNRTGCCICLLIMTSK